MNVVNLNPLRSRNILSAKLYAARIGWRKPIKGKRYPYNSEKRGWPRA